MSDLSLAIIVTGCVVILIGFALRRLGSWMDKNRARFERELRKLERGSGK